MSEDGRGRPPSAPDHQPPDKKALNEFSERLRKARKAGEPPTPQTQRGVALGIAFRLITEFVAAVVVGGAIGWFLDDALGTSPFLLLVFFFLGVAAGIFNVVRTARELNLTIAEDGNEENESGS